MAALALQHAAVLPLEFYLVVAIFQALHDRDELDQHTDLLARCNGHAAALGEVLESRDVGMMRAAVTSVIEDFRLASSL